MATPLDKIFCYNEGTYATTNAKKFDVPTGVVALLKPGTYYMKSGMQIRGKLFGGYSAGNPGVALVFDENNNQPGILDANNAEAIALNAGTQFPNLSSGGAVAAAARDWNNQPVQTSGPDSPNPPLPITLYVKRDTACYVPVAPQDLIEPTSCDANDDKTISMAGGGILVLAGVQYAPTDNVVLSGNSAGTGYIGQVISWTLEYKGGSIVNQEGPKTQDPGLLRLDSACTAPGTDCNP
jgi:hypothetical protein